ncbi:Type-1 restriction enzyme EcoKI specificity protein [Zhongshania aliphaticivorans]|uniref:Type-1 restriction enzyme EcoKI specificity protein n=1 Tax=Zhongshania aliphaticivorans TaxID=1470434 RepID=A0A5S9N6U0_9GAMM|nr:restriction endonuclease subunit S [Zhongshania aliphaticivorans]CAA0081107.1 Type-1 restriction enzyme EcoKI specificity protein [Zhongshania aliphaticivorans]CAA0085268.1 Type-1 restriction enzyme EcoKI specificity protein [Zhongshania aliphaticivorans]
MSNTNSQDKVAEVTANYAAITPEAKRHSRESGNLEIPNCWTSAKLTDIAILNMGQSPSSSDVNTNGTGIVFFQGKAEFGKLYPTPKKYCTAPKKIAESGDILLSIRAPVGPTNLANQKTAIGRGLAAIKATPSLTDPKFLLHYFRALEPWLSQQGTGTTFKAVSGQFLKEITATLPPLAEQKVIADKLDELLAQVDTLKTRLDAIPAILKRFRQSVLAAAVSGKLTEEWRDNKHSFTTKELIKKLDAERREVLEQEISQGNKETARLLKKIKSHSPKLPDETLPTNWEWTTFMQAMERVVDCHNKTAPYENDGIPLIRTPDIRDGKISLDGARYISQKTYEYWSRRCPPEQGDIIFTREAPMGEAGIVPKGVTLCMGQRMMLLRPMPKFVNPEYTLLNIQSVQFQERMLKQAIGTGVKHLRVADVEALVFPLAPLAEQTEIVRRVDQLFAYADQIEQQVKNAQARVNQLTQSILAKAFRGELTAQWREENPELISGENSAEALLERIKAERAAATTKKTRTKKPATRKTKA